MKLHHDKQHRAYVDALNAAEAAYAKASPGSVLSSIKLNGGGACCCFDRSFFFRAVFRHYHASAGTKFSESTSRRLA
jgi:superoxide dismutase